MMGPWIDRVRASVFFYALGDVSWWTQEYGEAEDYKQQHMFAIRE